MNNTAGSSRRRLRSANKDASLQLVAACSSDHEGNTPLREETLEERTKRVFNLTDREQNEVAYRRYSALSFILVMIVFGVPLWWYTTSTYRVVFQSFPTDQQITIQVYVKVEYFNDSLGDYMQSVESHLSNALFSLPKIERLNLNFSVILEKHIDRFKVPEASMNEKRFIAYMSILDESEWPYPGFTAHFGANHCVILNTMDTVKLTQRLVSSVIDVLLDMSHLNTIVRRDLKKRPTTDEITALSPSQQKRLVWDSAALSAGYIVQIIFVHSSNDESSDEIWENDLISNARRFAMKMSEVIDLSVSSEHLWDFDLAAWLKKSDDGRWIIKMDDVSSIVTAVDQETSTVESSAPVLKFVIFDTIHPITLLDQLENESSGFVVASWGALLSQNGSKRSKISQSLIGAMRVLFGLDTKMPLWSIRHPVPVAHWELNRLKLRSFIDSSINGVSSVVAIHNLISQIDSIVINDEVAKQVNSAVNLISSALLKARMTGEIDVLSVVKGRARAESALNDKSLLALLYFPNDQKFAIYLPLFLPTLLPLLGSIFAFYKQWKQKR